MCQQFEIAKKDVRSKLEHNCVVIAIIDNRVFCSMVKQSRVAAFHTQKPHGRAAARAFMVAARHLTAAAAAEQSCTILFIVAANIIIKF